MNKKKLILAIVAVVVVAAIAVGVWLLAQPQTSADEKTFTVTVVHADGTSKDFTYTSAEEYVGTVLQAEGLIEGPIESYGIYIQVVDGERAVYEEDGAYWSFNINGEYALTGVDETPITDGGVYSLEYTIG